MIDSIISCIIVRATRQQGAKHVFLFHGSIREGMDYFLARHQVLYPQDWRKGPGRRNSIMSISGQSFEV
jgi:hypothetical protein